MALENLVGGLIEKMKEKERLDDLKYYENLYQGMIEEGAQQGQKAAEEYRQKLPGIQTQMGQVSAGAGRQQLKGGLKDINRAYNRRGLLHSGLRQGARQGATGGFYGDLAQKQAQINRQTTQQARGLEDRAFQLGLKKQQAKLQALQNQYNEELQSKMRQQEQGQKGLGGLISGIGGLLGL